MGVVPLLISHLKGSGAHCDYKADSPCMGPVSTLHFNVLSELILKNEDGPSESSPCPRDTLCAFPVLHTREAKLNEIQQRLMEIIFYLRIVQFTSHINYIISSLVSHHSFFPTWWVLLC